MNVCKFKELYPIFFKAEFIFLNIKTLIHICLLLLGDWDITSTDPFKSCTAQFGLVDFG